MVTDNYTLMQDARKAIDGRWGLAIGVTLIYMILSSVTPFNIIIGGPLAVGLAGFSLRFARRQEADVPDMFMGFNNFWNALLAYLLIIVYVILWSLLLIIPGIIVAISYTQTFYILSDHPEIDPQEAMRKSQVMMNGFKWKYFGLCMRFFIWGLLCILTLGIGFLWLIPWMQVTFAAFHDDLRKNGTQVDF